MAKNTPEGESSNVLRFQPAVSKATDASRPKRKAAASEADPIAQEGLRLFKTFFAIEDVALRSSLLAMLENIAAGTRAGTKCGKR